MLQTIRFVLFTGVFSLLISNLSIAAPMASNAEAPPQKTEQTTKKKTNFIQKIILKKMKKKVAKAKAKGKVSNLAIASVVLGGVGIALMLLTGVTGILSMVLGILAALAGGITGLIARDGSGTKSDKIAKIGMWLGFVAVVLAVLFSIWAIIGLSNWADGWK